MSTSQTGTLRISPEIHRMETGRQYQLDTNCLERRRHNALQTRKRVPPLLRIRTTPALSTSGSRRRKKNCSVSIIHFFFLMLLACHFGRYNIFSLANASFALLGYLNFPNFCNAYYTYISKHFNRSATIMYH